MRLILAYLALATTASALAADGPSPYRVVTPRDEGIIATGLNAKGDLIGFEWAEEKEHKGVIEQVPFFARGGKDPVRIPLLKGYTATFPFGVSDDGVVVGRSSKPGRPQERIPLRNQAFIWDKTNGIRGLGTVEGDWASIATAINAKGTVIAGYSVGDNRVNVCVWERNGPGDSWKATALPAKGQVTSQSVALSTSGNRLASLDGPNPCLWTRSPDGWIRKEIGEGGAFAPRGVNDSGMVVGVKMPNDGSQAAVVWTPARGLVPIELPRGFVRSEATAVNNKGEVVGWADGPGGSDLGPRAFVWADGKFRFLDEFRSIMSSATAINDAGQISGIIEKDEEPAPKDQEKKKD